MVITFELHSSSFHPIDKSDTQSHVHSDPYVLKQVATLNKTISIYKLSDVHLKKVCFWHTNIHGIGSSSEMIKKGDGP